MEALQARLNALGANPLLDVDGEFGARTEAAVIAFQRERGLEADGIVGRLTGAALGLPAAVPTGGDARILRAMELLVDLHAFPVNGAAGLVGNLWAESAVMPNRIEGSSAATPMRARNFAGQLADFTPEEVMNRNPGAGIGPRLPGVGLAQWTAAGRRDGLFRHVFQGAPLGAAILFNLEAQVDYLAEELRRGFPGVNAILRQPGVTVDDASDEVAYRFEVPGVVLDANGNLLPRSAPRVQELFRVRRAHAHRALQVYRSVHP